MKKIYKKLPSFIASLLRSKKEEHSKSEPVCGSVIDKTNPNAPKVIRSKDIAEFRTLFHLYTRKTVGGKHRFAFSVKTDDNGVFKATEEYSAVACVADKTLTEGLQVVIDKNKLALKNGVYKIVAGLPPEYGECMLCVKYASGETLNFTVNNDPNARWAEMFCDTFAACFLKNGVAFNLKTDEE